ncbi:MAG: RNA pyrophosphohydrolase [Alphaproteobacteria bacterium]|nr:RNA pyrophosphohydrolase [Alphaproteobacteria bacterium]MDA7987676.1 RNA pyrophosphohydrolase [Alphaproteobacteria bacterium]MDA8000028.1 RNA pyrophosphohydrolase [Alphaproteobacteria bacterium]MDA8004179.1 RNA pyrophosphohydrolase [Alphaproteobacteria bacterium]MDA8006504.1 RNA pyrophosphohydrolase [Alphaproteobacteria bacterium]
MTSAPKKTRIYIDGFNLYQGCLRDTPYRWLNCETLCQKLLPDNREITGIKYFAAPLEKRPQDAPSKVEYQQVYWRALNTLNNLEIIEGFFQKEGKGYREKQSDVNLAAHLINDAHLNRFDTAVIVSGDNDFAGAVELVKNDAGKEVGVFLPQPPQTARKLCAKASFERQIHPELLARCQFDENLEDHKGPFHMPKGWNQWERLRRGIGAVLFNNNGLALMGRRADSPDNAWQFPQGGIDKGEDPRAALRREMFEEVGTNNFSIVAESDGWLRYRLPEEMRNKLWDGKYVGQKQRWYLLRFLGEDSEININACPAPEFTDWGWFPPEEAERRIVPFKQELYKNLTRSFAPLIHDELKTTSRRS